MPRKKKRETWSLVLLVFVGLRVLGQLVSMVLTLGAFSAFTHLIFFVLFGLAFYGLWKREVWGAELALLLALGDAVLSIVDGGLTQYGAIIGDTIIAVLAVQERTMLNKGKKRS